MLVSRHRIGEYLPEVVHQGPDPAAVAVCREVLAESGAECVIPHGSRGWSGWDEQSDLNLILVCAADDRVGRHSPPGTLGLVKERHYPGYRDDRVHGLRDRRHRGMGGGSYLRPGAVAPGVVGLHAVRVAPAVRHVRVRVGDGVRSQAVLNDDPFSIEDGQPAAARV